jgi:hypothetical protein
MDSTGTILTPKQNMQLRARMKAIQRLTGQFPEQARFLRGGTVPEICIADYGNVLSEEYRELESNRSENSKPLTFTELCSFSTWYFIHPEKVAGKEYLTTSLSFPVSVKGTKEDIIHTIQKTIAGSNETRLRVAKAKAKAKLKFLKLLQS